MKTSLLCLRVLLLHFASILIGVSQENKDTSIFGFSQDPSYVFGTAVVEGLQRVPTASSSEIRSSVMSTGNSLYSVTGDRSSALSLSHRLEGDERRVHGAAKPALNSLSRVVGAVEIGQTFDDATDRFQRGMDNGSFGQAVTGAGTTVADAVARSVASARIMAQSIAIGSRAGMPGVVAGAGRGALIIAVGNQSYDAAMQAIADSPAGRAVRDASSSAIDQLSLGKEWERTQGQLDQFANDWVNPAAEWVEDLVAPSTGSSPPNKISNETSPSGDLSKLEEETDGEGGPETEEEKIKRLAELARKLHSNSWASYMQLKSAIERGLARLDDQERLMEMAKKSATEESKEEYEQTRKEFDNLKEELKHVSPERIREVLGSN